MTDAALTEIAVVVVLGVGAQWVAARLRVPSILLLLTFGFVAGPVAGWVHPDERLGELLFPLVSVSVGLILYEGGLTLKLAELRKGQTGRVVSRLCSVGALVSWLVSSVAALLIFRLDVGVAVLLGAILVVTGPTVIGPLLRHIRPTGVVGPILKWEGIVIDPIGAMLAVLVFEGLSLVGTESATGVVFGSIARTVIVGGGLGIVAGYALAFLLARYWVPDYLQNAVSLMFVVAVFVVSDAVQSESGLLSATVMGIVLANQKLADVRHIVEFKENLRVLLISSLFILLAARQDLGSIAGIGWDALLFVAVLLLVARPLSAWISTARAGMKASDRLLIAWMAPRGIVAAAVSSLFALRLEEAGYADAHLLVPITFIAIIGTVAIYGLTSPVVARWLGVADPDPQGVLIVGAQPWTRALAGLLREKGFATLIVDSNRHQITQARMEGHPVYSGSILADYALDEINLGGIGRLMAATPNDWVNALAAQRLARIFGTAHCYQLPPRNEPEKQITRHKHLHGRWLFGKKHTYADLARRFTAEHTVKATKLTEEFDYEAFRAKNRADAVPLAVITESGRLRIITADEEPRFGPGQTLISMVREQKLSADAVDGGQAGNAAEATK